MAPEGDANCWASLLGGTLALALIALGSDSPLLPLLGLGLLWGIWAALQVATRGNRGAAREARLRVGGRREGQKYKLTGVASICCVVEMPCTASSSR